MKAHEQLTADGTFRIVVETKNGVFLECPEKFDTELAAWTHSILITMDPTVDMSAWKLVGDAPDFKIVESVSEEVMEDGFFHAVAATDKGETLVHPRKFKLEKACWAFAFNVQKKGRIDAREWEVVDTCEY